MNRIISLHYASTSLYYYNSKRVLSLDLAKGFTVLFIPSIHVVMLYSSATVHHTILGTLLSLIAEWPGAQILMFAMGLSSSLSKKSLGKELKRALLIFGLGYVLNATKFLLLYRLNWLPASFINDLHFSHVKAITINLLLIGDILQFAGLSLAVLAIVKTWRPYAFIAVLLTYLIIIASPLLWDWHHANMIIDHLLHLMGGSIDNTFFPLFPWLVYPLTGLAIGAYLQGPSSIKPILVSGGFMLVSGLVMQWMPFHFPSSLFWRTYPDKTIMHLGFVMVWMAFWLWLTSAAFRFKRWLPWRLDGLSELLCFCGRNITVIYIVQWVLIFWMLPFWGYHRLDMAESLIALSLVNALVFGWVQAIVKRKRTKL